MGKAATDEDSNLLDVILIPGKVRSHFTTVKIKNKILMTFFVFSCGRAHQA
jgi:hypothetical protein